MDLAMLWRQVDAIEAAFAEEAGALSGKEMWERAERTNAVLRTSWPVLKAALPPRPAP